MTLLEEVQGGGAHPWTPALLLMCRVLGTPARTHYFVLLITHAVSTDLTGLIGHMLGGSPQLPLYCSPHPVLDKAALNDEENPYAAVSRVRTLRASRMRACRSAKMVLVMTLVELTPRPRLVGRMRAVSRRRIQMNRCWGDMLLKCTGC